MNLENLPASCCSLFGHLGQGNVMRVMLVIFVSQCDKLETDHANLILVN